MMMMMICQMMYLSNPKVVQFFNHFLGYGHESEIEIVPAASKPPPSKKPKSDPENLKAKASSAKVTDASANAPAKHKWIPGQQRAGPSAPGSQRGSIQRWWNE